MSPAARSVVRRNGKVVPKRAVCKHAPTCELAESQRDLQALVQKVSESIGMMLERMERHDNQIVKLLGRIREMAEWKTVLNQREEEWLRLLGKLQKQAEGET